MADFDPFAPVNCRGCNKQVFASEKVTALKSVWHRGCLKCATCGFTLTTNNLESYQNVPYCKAHKPNPKHTAVKSVTDEVAIKAPKAARRVQGISKDARMTFAPGAQGPIRAEGRPPPPAAGARGSVAAARAAFSGAPAAAARPAPAAPAAAAPEPYDQGGYDDSSYDEGYGEAQSYNEGEGYYEGEGEGYYEGEAEGEGYYEGEGEGYYEGEGEGYYEGEAEGEGYYEEGGY